MNKKSWIAIALSVLAIVLAVVGGNFYQPQIGSTNQQNAEGSRFPNGISSGEGSLVWNREVIEAGSNQSYIYNNSGKTLCAVFSDIITSSTASSSVTFDVGTSTTSSLDKDYDFGATSFGSLIDGAIQSTSTTETYFDSISQGITGKKTVCFDNGTYLVYLHHTTNEVEGNNACSYGGVGTQDNSCDTATSTNLGIWPIEWNVLLTATSTQ